VGSGQKNHLLFTVHYPLSTDMPRTRIVCTLGPATASSETLRALVRSGMHVARLNFSHGTQEEHAQLIELVRRIATEESAVVALLGDLQGPKIRVGNIPGDQLQLAAGEPLILTSGPPQGANQVKVDFPPLARVVKPAEHLLLDDGNIELEVDHIEGEQVITRVVNGGVLKSHKGVNFPGIDLPIPSLTPKDLADLDWAIGAGLDYIALSFVRRAEDVIDLRQRVQARGANIPIIAKIEKREAVAAIDAILQAADGVMVARGDLGVEMPAEQVPIYQKQIIRKANALGKPVITATQMLESMIEHPRPTRAEASDVANAILDGSDAVMLSAETSVGKYPVAAVQAMARIADFTEKNLRHDCAGAGDFGGEEMSVTDAIGQATVEIACEVGARLIITLTTSGYTARMVARHRPEMPMLACTTSEETRHRLALVWGAQSVLLAETQDTEQVVSAALEAARVTCHVQPGDRVVVTAGVPPGLAGQTNMIQVRKVP
jgi:pyruvate kinase